MAWLAGEAVGIDTPPDYDWRDPRHRVGLLDLETLELRWVALLRGRGDGAVRRITVSDDGRYVAIGGWSNGVAMIDAVNQEVMWIDRPPTEVSTGYVWFSSDAKTLYTAGSEGCVYIIDAQTGDIRGRWWASESGESVYGHRVSCLAVSPDGSSLAAGTGPEGKVFLLESLDDKQPRLLPHGHRTILTLSFSPDSKYLASVTAGVIKIWKVRE